MTSAHPPMEHNPHVWADINRSPVTVSVQDSIPVLPEPEPGVNPVAAITVTAPDGTVTSIDPASGTTGTVEGGEQPSVSPQETTAPAGTASSASSSPAATSDSSSASKTPSPAPSAASPSAPVASPAKSTAPGVTGTGTGR